MGLNWPKPTWPNSLCVWPTVFIITVGHNRPSYVDSRSTKQWCVWPIATLSMRPNAGTSTGTNMSSTGSTSCAWAWTRLELAGRGRCWTTQRCSWRPATLSTKASCGSLTKIRKVKLRFCHMTCFLMTRHACVPCLTIFRGARSFAFRFLLISQYCRFWMVCRLGKIRFGDSCSGMCTKAGFFLSSWPNDNQLTAEIWCGLPSSDCWLSLYLFTFCSMVWVNYRAGSTAVKSLQRICD